MITFNVGAGGRAALTFQQRTEDRRHVEQTDTCSRRSASSTGAGRKRSTRTTVPPIHSGPRVAITQPAVWNIGSGFRHTEPASTPTASSVSFATLTKDRCLSRTPLGRPVVPEVYCSMTASSGSVGSRRGRRCSPRRPATASRSDSEMQTRFGSPAATPSTTAARSSSRLVSAWRRTDARECVSA